MTTNARPFLAAIVCAGALTVLGACGSASPPTTSPSTSTSGTLATPPHDPAVARQVTMLRTGGLKPARLVRVFAPDKPPPDGLSRAQVDAVLRLAVRPVFQTLPAKPTDTCCDRYVYRVTVTRSDGTGHTFTTVDGAAQPPAVGRLVRLMTA